MVKCPKCGINDANIILSNYDYLHGIGEYLISECNNCGFWYQSQIPNDISSLYPKDFGQHNNIPSKTPKHSYLMSFLKQIKDRYYGNKIGLIPELIEDGVILEIGCGHGYGLLELKNRGWKNIHGIELVENAVLSARQKGFWVDYGPVEEILPMYPDNSFDVIIASVVMEHLTNPFDTCTLIFKKLKPGGKFLFSTTQRTSIEYLIYKNYWSGFDIRHMVFFRKRDIYDMLKDFTDIRIYHQPISVDFYRSSDAKIKDGVGTLFDKFIISLGWNAWNIFLLPFSLLNMTSRISVHCKKHNKENR